MLTAEELGIYFEDYNPEFTSDESEESNDERGQPCEIQLEDPQPLREIQNGEITFELLKNGSTRGRDLLQSSDGHEFNCMRCRNGKSYYRCTSRKTGCGVCVVFKNGIYRPNATIHNHASSNGKRKKRKLYASGEAKGKENFFSSASSFAQPLLVQEFKNSSHPDTPSVNAISKAINRARNSLRPDDPIDLEFEIDESFKQFLKADIEMQSRRHLIFATDKQLENLEKTKIYYVDATFKIVKPPFTQLWSIHAYIEFGTTMKQVPLLFVLMSGKSKADYVAVLRTIKKAAPSVALERFVIDFEAAM